MLVVSNPGFERHYDVSMSSFVLLSLLVLLISSVCKIVPTLASKANSWEVDSQLGAYQTEHLFGQPYIGVMVRFTEPKPCQGNDRKGYPYNKICLAA